MQPIITENREKIAELCRTHHVRRLSVFGSAVRDDFDPARSDVDFLVDFEAVEAASSWKIQVQLREAFAHLFERPVDLIQVGTIRNPYIRQEIEAEQETLYAA